MDYETQCYMDRLEWALKDFGKTLGENEIDIDDVMSRSRGYDTLTDLEHISAIYAEEYGFEFNSI